MDNTMNFREAARRLGEQVTTAMMAERLGVSEHTVRQARLEPGASGHRTPPAQWRAALAEMAEERGRDLRKLAEELRRGTGEGQR
jgi:hypothetical protein